MKHLTLHRALLTLTLMLASVAAWAADIDRFAGTYVGSADFVYEGKKQRRDMSATIIPKDRGFILSWTSVSFRADGSEKAKKYTIEFSPSKRPNIFGSAMTTNMFGKRVPLDPLQGEPFVWSRLEGDTFSVFSLFITEEGDYEMQEYHRSLAEGGLDLVFRRVRNGVPLKEIKAFLKKQA